MGKAKRFNSYDSSVAEQRKLIQSYGQARQNLSGITSTFRNPALPPITVLSGITDGTGDGKFLTVSLAADQITNIAATNHVEFDTKDEDGGIVLQTGAGQADGIFELSSGKKYQLSAHLRPEFSGATGQLVIAWYDITNAAEIGSRAIYESQTNTSHNANQPVAEAIVTPAANITVEVRIISVTALTALANEYCVANLFEIALGGSGTGAGGGGGGGSGTADHLFAMYTSNPTAADPLPMPTSVVSSSGTSITINNPTTDRVRLTAGKTYRLEAKLAVAAGNTGFSYGWFDDTAAAIVGVEAHTRGSNVSALEGFDLAVAVLTPATTRDYRLDRTSVIGSPAIDQVFSYVWVAEVSGGGGTASFPLDYTIDDQGSKTGTVTHDLSLATAHKLKFTATGTITLAFTNYPTSGNAIDWYVDVTQDGTGGHAINFPAEVINAPTFSTVADTTSLITLHTDDNGTIVRAVTLINAAPSSGSFADTDLKNLVTPILNAFIDFNSKAPTNFPGFTNAVGQALVVDGAGVTWDMPTGDTYKHRVNGVNIAEITSVGLAMAGTISMGENFITLADIATPADPGAGERRLFVDTGTGELSVRTNASTTISLEASSTSTFDDNAFTIQDEVDNSKTITFNASILSASATVLMSYAAGASRTYTFPAATGTVPLLGLAQTWGATQTFQIIQPDGNGTRDFGSTIAYWDDVFTENLTLRGSGDAIVSTRPMITADGSNVIFHAPAADDFIWQVAGATTKMQFNTTGGSDDIRIRAGASRVLGFITDSSATTLGTSGTIKIPVDTGSVGNAAAADTDFGDDVGCEGLYLNTIGVGNPTYVLKIDDGTGTDNRWLALTYNRTTGALSGGVLT